MRHASLHRNRLLNLVELSHRMTSKHARIQQALEPRYARRTIYHLRVGGLNQCADLEEEPLSFPKAVNDDASDSAGYQAESAQPVGPVSSAARSRRYGGGSRRMVRDDRYRTERHEPEATEHRGDGKHEEAAGEDFV